MTRSLDSEDVVLPTGEVIDGKYEIISKIGQGGMGVVYKARDPMKREVAVKLLTHVDDETIQRFHREAETLASVKHRAVMRVDSFGESSYGPYLVVEYVAGRDLGSVAKFPLPVEEAVDLTLAICSGVSACHAAQIVHRDLKPSNIRVKNVTRWSERVKILDFGLAIPFDSPILKSYQTRITNMGSVPGTPRYIAPELLRHQPPTPECDQYGIVSLLYLLLTGRPPYHDIEGDELLAAIMHGDYVALRMLRSGVPQQLQDAIARGLAVDPNERFPTVNDFALEIVTHATPSLKTSYTRYFSNAQHIDRRLLEPVSAFRKPPSPVLPLVAARVTSGIESIRPAGAPKIVAPLQEKPSPGQTPIVAPRVSSAPPVPPLASAAPPRIPSPPPQLTAPVAPLPETSLAARSREVLRRMRKRKVERGYSILFVFICGAVFGACLTVGAFICLLLYEHHAAFCTLSSPSPVTHVTPVVPSGKR